MPRTGEYPAYPQDALALEEQVLTWWREESLFARTLEATRDGPPFVFFEGPPTANGRPGIHHVLSRTIKDLVCRYRTMRGHAVTRIAGWDTHGLPVEIEAEKRLGISGKRQIEELGVARFNEVCRESVFTYQEEWERLSERIGYWLDYSRPYITYAPDYIESVWWILAQLHRGGLVYRGHKSVPFCPRCGTALSSHEVAQGYEDVEDPSIHFLAPVLTGAGEEDPDRRAFLVWTTTPWTLPANAGLAVDPGLEYVEVQWQDRRLIVAAARAAAIFGEDVAVVGRCAGRELVGMLYRRPFDLIPEPAERGGGWTVVPEDFVSAEEGTGIVHLAPAFGADDYAAGQRHGLPMFRPLDDTGTFDAALPLVGGLFAKASDEPLVADLRDRGLVFRYRLESHSYPHCWRCGSPLLYMARDSWFIRTTAVRDRMLANNREVRWHPPEVGTGRFGEWLEGNIDWALSRERYWGTPLPAWVCDGDAAHVEFIGSFAELAERVGPLPADFDPHKPHIDALTWPCPHCAGAMHRTPEVIDVWFDSGAMPFAQWHYPFENQEQFQRHFPADFICEGVDQTRGWFYSLMAISTLLGRGPAYRNVLVNDLVLDAQGQKMSKSRGNVVDPWSAIGESGVDAIRWYFLVASQPWVPKRFDPQALGETARRTFDTLANTYRFFALYANLEPWRDSDRDPPSADRPVLDRWVLSRLHRLVGRVGEALDAYDLTRAGRLIADYIVDDVSNWYVRRSRDRFWGSGDDAGTRAAFRTLHEVLVTTARLLAPFTPFVSDWLHRALRDAHSVHLAGYPAMDPALTDDDLEAEMEAVRTLARLGRAARERVRIRVRQPLAVLHAVIPGRVAVRPELLDVLTDELNVREVRFLAGVEDLVRLRARPNFRSLGARYGKRTPHVAEAARSLDQSVLQALRRGDAVSILLDGEALRLEPGDVELQEEPLGELVVESDGGHTAALDPRIDEDLRLEGLARELVSRIQRLRREAGLEVHDRIRLVVTGDAAVEEAARRHGPFIGSETLALEVAVGAGDAERAQELELDGLAARIGLSVVGKGERARG
jgi:isoleucyl-tRNA synthetase